MQSPPIPTKQELVNLLQNLDDKQLSAALQRYGFTLETVQHLKAYSTEFHFTEPEHALEIAQAAYRLGQILPAPAAALGAWALGNAFIFLDNFAAAEQHFQQAQAAYTAQNDLLNAARVAVGQVFALAYSGKGDEALTLANTVEPILRKAAQTDPADLERLGGLLMNTGVAHELLGQYEEAFASHEQLVTIAETLGDPLMLAQAKHNQAYARVQTGSFTEAVATYQAAEQLLKGLDAHYDLSRLYINYAALLTLLEEFQAARDVQDQAETLLAELEGSEQQKHWLTIFRAQVDLQAKWPITDVLLEKLHIAQRAFQQQGPRFGEGLSWLALGHGHLRRQEWQQAEQAFRAADQLTTTEYTLKYRVLHGMGQLAAAQQRTADAITAFQAAIAQIESIREDLYTETVRADFLTDKLIVYQHLARLYLNTGQPEAAFRTIEQAKSRLLTEKLTYRLSEEAAALDVADDEELQGLQAQLNALLHKLDTLYRRAQAEGRQNASEFLNLPTVDTLQTLAAVEEDVQRVTFQIQRTRPLFSPYATGEPAALSQIQSHLQGRKFLQYHINDGEIWAMVVGESSLQEYRALATLKEIDQLRQQFSATVERTLELGVRFGLTRAQRYLPALQADAQAHLHRLYTLLIAPLLPELTTVESLVVAPDQTLHYLPFHAFYTGSAYLLEQYTISYTPSATVLDLCLRYRTTSQNLLAFGYDNENLAAVEAELAMLQQLSIVSDCFQGAAGTAAEFLQRAPHYRLLHLATHAQFRMDKPMLSSLTLADRQLTLAEIARLRLTAEMVVLSGCETGHGRLHGSDLLNLASGFLSSGARSLLISLWRVNDKMATELMTAFYRNLQDGFSRAEALRQAQRQLLRSAQQDAPEQQVHAHPAYWAPFIMVGSWQPITPFS